MQNPETAVEDVLNAKIDITDEELAALSAVDKVKLLKDMVSAAVENILGLNLSWDEKVMVMTVS